MPSPMTREGEQFRKIFIGGLSFETTEESLKAYFEKWGEVVDCVVMKDNQTQRSRGFGFITYQDAESVNDAQDARPHTIDGKEVESKRATPREESHKPNAHQSVKKLYVSGIKDVHCEEHLMEYFGTYGAVEKIEIITDKETQKKRGFAFVTFTDYDPVDKICLEKNHYIHDHRCDVKKAMSKEQQQQSKGMGGRAMGGGQYGGHGMGMGMGGGGFGGGMSRGGGRGRGGYGGGSYGGGSFDSYSGGGGYGGGYEDSYGGGQGYGSGGYGGGAMRGGGYNSRNSGGPYGGGYGRSSGYGQQQKYGQY